MPDERKLRAFVVQNAQHLNMEEEEKRQQRRRKKQQVISCCKKSIAFLFSHIGLAGMVVVYTMAGGFMFRELERHHEKAQRNTMQDYRELHLAGISNIADDYKYLKRSRSNVTDEILRHLTEYKNELYVAIKEKGWDGKEFTNSTNEVWSFSGSLLYSVTVITTIGYGHIAPKTHEGRLVTIVYALIGIPLSFMFLSNIGNFLADCFKTFYQKICCDICCCQRCERKRRRERARRRRNKELTAAQQSLHLATLANLAAQPNQDGGDVREEEDDIDDIESSSAGKPESEFSDETLSYSESGTFEPLDDDDMRDAISSESFEMEDKVKMAAADPPNKSQPTQPDLTHNPAAFQGSFDDLPETDIIEDEAASAVTSPANLTPPRKDSNTPYDPLTFLQHLDAAQETPILGDSDDDESLARKNKNNNVNTSLEESKNERIKGANVKEKKGLFGARKSKKTNEPPTVNNPKHTLISKSTPENSAAEVTLVCDDNGKTKSVILKAPPAKTRSNSDKSNTTKKAQNKIAMTSSNKDERTLKNAKVLSRQSSDDSFQTPPGGSSSKLYDSQEIAPKGNNSKKQPIDDHVTITVDNPRDYLELLEYPDLAKDSAAIEYKDDAFEFEDDDHNKHVTVPISVCLIIIAGYIIGGGVLFKFWEGWDIITSSYFCFITLSTIGFGDFVPGAGTIDTDSNVKMVSCTLWLAFGLSLLAMCFNLMQEEVTEKFKWLGTKLGLLKTGDDG